jgi:hypothetical protein
MVWRKERAVEVGFEVEGPRIFEVERETLGEEGDDSVMY